MADYIVQEIWDEALQVGKDAMTTGRDVRKVQGGKRNKTVSLQ
jgi:hypothetical protein